MLLKLIRIQLLLCLLLAAVLTGCDSLRFYSQAVSGQIALLNKRRSIDRFLADAQTPEKLKNKLRLILELRAYAINTLHLPVNDHYLSFVELDRPYVLWIVYATPEFSLTPKTWCHPVVGCTAYRGYFSQENAQRYADKLKKEKLDVYVGGVRAYSTLGWFDDPVYSSFVYDAEAELAALVFHELAHQILYVNDDTTFNESFATAVEQEAVRRWLAARNNPAAFGDYQASFRRRRQFVQLIEKYRGRLTALYSKDLPEPEKRRIKALVFDELKDEYRLLKQQWDGDLGYDAWFGHKLNNAQLITVSIYHDLVPAFLSLLQACDNDLQRFYQKCRDLAQKSKAERQLYLQKESRILLSPS